MINNIIFEMIKERIKKFFFRTPEEIWHKINNRKDMPKRFQMILYITDMGHIFVGYWNAHEKALYHHNLNFEEHKLVPVRRGLKGVIAWSNKSFRMEF